MIRCDISKTLGKQKKYPQLETVALGVLFLKTFSVSQYKSEESKRGLAAISSTVCLLEILNEIV